MDIPLPLSSYLEVYQIKLANIEWRSLFPISVLRGSQPISKFLLSVGYSKSQVQALVKYLKQIPSFSEWYSVEDQKRLAMISRSEYGSVGYFIYKYELPKKWRDFITGQVLEYKVTLRDFCRRQYGIIEDQVYDNILKCLKRDSSFVEWFGTVRQQSIDPTRSAKSLRLSLFESGNKTVSFFVDKYGLPEAWKLFLSKDVLEYRKGFHEYLAELGALEHVSKGVLKVCKASDTFLKWYSSCPVKEIASFKRRETNLTKYGFSSSLSNPIVREKCRHSNRVVNDQKFYAHYGLGYIDELLIRAGIKALFVGKPQRGVLYIGVCSRCGRAIEFHFYSSGGSFGWLVTDCYYCSRVNKTKLETSIAEMLLSRGIDAKPDFSVLEGRQIDVYLPEYKIGFEVNGAYSHNSALFPCIKSYHTMQLMLPKSRDYHEGKTVLALSKGVKLYHLWEHWGQEKCFNFVKAKLDMFDYRVPARALLVRFNDPMVGEFFDRIHTQRCIQHTFSVSLVSVSAGIIMSSLIVVKNNEALLARNAVEFGYSVIGGFSKILYHVRSELASKFPDVSKIITFADRDLTPDPKDSVYIRHGFVPVGKSTKEMFYYSTKKILDPAGKLLVSPSKVYSRFKFQKHKLSVFNGCIVNGAVFEFDMAITEQENLFKLGIHPVYNSGCFKYELVL